VVIAISNPKSLVYMVALLPPFVDAAQPVGGQIVVLALVAMAIDLTVGALYILAGRRLSGAMSNPTARRWVDRGVGTAFLLIAGLIGLDLVTSPM
jgi:threonine/homoserine/homoserine lactone efflux protein